LSTPPSIILQLSGVGLRYGEAAAVLHDIDLRLEAGSFHFLSGPTGAGKTSLLRLMSLSLPPTTGAMRLFGDDIATLDRTGIAVLRQRIGVVFQDFRLLEHLSAFDNVALPLRINGADEDETARFVADMLGWLGLGNKLDALPADLSMGQRQMICIARAVVGKPRLLLADEPTSNIDAKNAERLMNLFIQLHKLGTAVVFATHSQTLLDRYPYPILEMAAGRLRAARRPAPKTPADTPVAEAAPPKAVAGDPENPGESQGGHGEVPNAAPAARVVVGD
jgi:cell division transport system ATP-binding protein